MAFLEMLIRRPIVAFVFNMLLVVIGVAAYFQLPVAQYPAISLPEITITTTYQGADAQLMEAEITTPIEQVMTGVEGVIYFTSTSTQGESVITVTMEMGSDVGVAASLIQNRVSQATSNFPAAALPPIVVTAASTPQIYMCLASKTASLQELTAVYNQGLVNTLNNIDGVDQIMTFDNPYAIRMWVDPAKLAAHDLTPVELSQAVQDQSVALSAGDLVNDVRQYDISTDFRLNTADEWNEMIVAYRDGFPIRFKDLGYAELSGNNVPPNDLFLKDGSIALGLAVETFASANAIDVSNSIRKLIPELNRVLPGDLELIITYDRTDFVRDSIVEIVKAMIEAVIFVIIVVSLFLLSWRAVLVPIVTIPLSLAGAMGLLMFLGFSINTMTLLALVLAIGLVVDDGIVVLENIFRYMENGNKPMTAAIEGLRDILFPLIATTTTLALVFAPVGLVPGQMGALFEQFAFTLAGTVLISGFIAMTLSPVMCRLLLRPSKKARKAAADGEVPAANEEGQDWISRNYGKIISFTLHHLRPVVILIAILVAICAYMVGRTLQSELLPTEDQSVVMVFYEGPQYASFADMRRNADEIDAILQKVPEGTLNINLVGTPSPTYYEGLGILTLVPEGQRKRSQQEIVKSLQEPISKVPGVFAFPLNIPPSVFGGASQQDVNYVWQTMGGYEELWKYWIQLRSDPDLQKYLEDIQIDLNLTNPQYSVKIDRDLARASGVSVADAGQTLAATFAPDRLNQFVLDGLAYWVYLGIHPDKLSDLKILDDIYVRGNEEKLVPLSALVSFVPEQGLLYANHYMGQKSLTINANVANGAALGGCLQFLEDWTTKNTDGIIGSTTGYSWTYEQGQGKIGMTFGLGILVVYLVLSAMFNSMVDPLIVLLVVPLSMLGALVCLKLNADTLNIYSEIGLLTLVGLISKHGILIVEVANRARAQGMEVMDAAIHAAQLRVRPILMTTGAMVLGAVPLIVEGGAGHETRQPVGWVLVGGMLFGTLMSLFVVPTVYSYFSSLQKKRFLPRNADGEIIDVDTSTEG
ncbi:MAG: efflux RND transporter permease subunit [Phycisphaerales bacterium]|nr:efflux RND transporter permease subunit [Phycisphaerales bacterium]